MNKARLARVASPWNCPLNPPDALIFPDLSYGFAGSHPMKNALVSVFLAPVAFSGFAAAEDLLQEDRKIEFDREIVLRIVPPCSLSAEGSKLTIYPRGIGFGDFSRGVTWGAALPGYLLGEKESSTDFDFDLIQRVSFRMGMVLKVARTTCRVTSGGTLVVHKGSRMPVIEAAGGVGEVPSR